MKWQTSKIGRRLYHNAQTIEGCQTTADRILSTLTLTKPLLTHGLRSQAHSSARASISVAAAAYLHRPYSTRSHCPSLESAYLCAPNTRLQPDARQILNKTRLRYGLAQIGPSDMSLLNYLRPPTSSASRCQPFGVYVSVIAHPASLHPPFILRFWCK